LLVKQIPIQNSNPDAKIIIDFPLWLKQFVDPRWLDETGTDFGRYVKEVLYKPENKYRMVEQWFEDKGKINNEQIGPNPEEVVKNLLEGLKRLKKFIRRFFPNRPIVIGFVGHSMEIDALFTYIANQGKINSEGFKKIGGEKIKETEAGFLEFSEDKIKLKYRGKEFEFIPEEHEESSD